MRLTISLLVAAAMTSSVAAQTVTLWYFPEGETQGSTSYTSRSGLSGADTGDVAQNFPAEFFASAAQFVDPTTNTVVNRVWGFEVLIQDQDTVTTPNEPYTFAILPDDPLNPGNPDPDANNEYIRTAPLTFPTTPGPIAAYRITTTLATPFDMPNNGDAFWLAVGLPPQPLWTADGLSVHETNLGPIAPPGPTNWDLPKLAWPNSGYTMPVMVRSITRNPPTPNPGVPAGSLRDRTHHLGILVDNGAITANVGSAIDPAQRGGGDNPTFGAGGSLPDHVGTRRDGVAIRVACASRPNAPYAVLTGFTPFGFGPNFANWTDPNVDGLLRMNFLLGLYTLGTGTTDALGFSRQTLAGLGQPNGWGVPIDYMSIQVFMPDFVTGRVHASNGTGLYSGD